MTVAYSSVGNPSSSFKQPRQKTWGVFQRPNVTTSNVYWDLVLMTNDLKSAKAKINDWLKNPPTGTGALPGLDNIILCEIVPVDSTVLV